MLTAAELEQLRTDALASLPDVCDVLRSTRVADGRGGQTTVWAALAEAVPCRLAPTAGTGSEDVEGARLTAEADWVLTLPYDAALSDAITTQDRIRINGQDHEVVAIAVRSWQLFTRLGLTSIK